jgi:hypothetical protein
MSSLAEFVSEEIILSSPFTRYHRSLLCQMCHSLFLYPRLLFIVDNVAAIVTLIIIITITIIPSTATAVVVVIVLTGHLIVFLHERHLAAGDNIHTHVGHRENFFVFVGYVRQVKVHMSRAVLAAVGGGGR